jgi:hypothetical protein
MSFSPSPATLSIEKQARLIKCLVKEHQVACDLFAASLNDDKEQVDNRERNLELRSQIQLSNAYQIGLLLETLTSDQREALWTLIQEASESGWKTKFR